MGDWSGFMDKIHEVVPVDQQPELLQKLTEGNFTMRIMYEQFQNILKMGPIGQVSNLKFLLHLFYMMLVFCCLIYSRLTVCFVKVFSMLPGFSAELMPKGREKESQAKIKRYMTMMDSMTNEGMSLLACNRDQSVSG